MLVKIMQMMSDNVTLFKILSVKYELLPKRNQRDEKLADINQFDKTRRQIGNHSELPANATQSRSG